MSYNLIKILSCTEKQMNKFLTIANVFSLLFFLEWRGLVYADQSKLATSPLDISGSYKCSGFDRFDGPLTGVITYTLDKDASDFEHQFSAYTYHSNNYTGFAAVQGTMYSYYFENKNHHDKKSATDRGVGIANITYDQNMNGTFNISVHSHYYQPTYERNNKKGYGTGGYGTAVCVKIDEVS